uniref:SDA1 N-terminal domain-containing protein n=1 Tax=Lygus hesperus TaxID=30085 RepID=A0A146MFZ9_LYGHE
MQMPKISNGASGDGIGFTNANDENDSDDEEEIDPGRTISKIKQKLKIVKKTSKRERILHRTMNTIKRKYNRKHEQGHEDDEGVLAKQHVDPVRLLRNPQQFV